MTAQRSEQAVVAEMSMAEERELVRRANQLCRRAEPHTEVVPCAAHLHEAQRQLEAPAL